MSSNPLIYYKQNRLKQLRAFCHTVRCGSITGAAEELFLSQSSISLQIKALERELNITLFERRGPHLNLTPEGQILYRLSEPLVNGIDNLQESFASHYGKLESGELNIAAGESTILYILPGLIKSFIEQYPQIEIKLHNVTGRDGMALLRTDKADFAVGSMLTVPDDIVYQPMFTYNPVLITSLVHPLAKQKQVSLKEISPHGLILPPHHLSTWRIVDLVFKQHNLSYKVALEAGGWEVIKKYVELNMGISIVTDVCITEEDKNKLAIIPLDKYFPKRSYGLVMRQGKFCSPQAKRFIDLMEPQFIEKGESSTTN
jgi:DNA-binding transcriptional LysR family regulator